MFANRIAAVLFGTLALCAASGCKTGSGDAGVKDLEATGESSSRKSDIDLKFYPVKGADGKAQIQMERCVTVKSTGATECTYSCATPENVVTALNDKGQDGNAVLKKIANDKKSKTQDEDLFKALQQAGLDANISSRCDSAEPFHPPQGETKMTNRERLESGAEVAQSYTLLDDGVFYRSIDGKRCDVTTKVEDFKISSHPNDKALAYFIKGGDLWVVNKSPDVDGNNCPPVKSKMILGSIAKQNSKYQYFVTSNTNTTIVNVGLSESGDFVGWDNDSAVVDEPSVKDVEMNTCFGAGLHKSFDSFVAFLQKQDGTIVKVKGVGDASTGFTSVHKGNFASINDFQDKLKVCQ